MQNVPLPDFYDDLDASLAEAWRCLRQGADDRRSEFHTPTLATVRSDGTPTVRTVVLRDADQQARSLRFHTDRRGRKIGEIEACPRVMLQFYSPGAKLQLRAEGCARVHTTGAVVDAAWAGSQFTSRQCYRIEPAPGTELPGSDDYSLASGDVADAGRENFAAVVITLDRLEWLYLAAQGHRRAEYAWNSEDLTAKWLAP